MKMKTPNTPAVKTGRTPRPTEGRIDTLDLTNLKMTPEEQDQLAWCHQNLDDIDVADIQEQAIEIATPEANRPVAAEKLLDLLVTVIVRNAHEQGCIV